MKFIYYKLYLEKGNITFLSEIPFFTVVNTTHWKWKITNGLYSFRFLKDYCIYLGYNSSEVLSEVIIVDELLNNAQ